MYKHQMHVSGKRINRIYKQNVEKVRHYLQLQNSVISRIARLYLGGKQQQDFEDSYRSSRRLLEMMLAKDGPGLHQPRKTININNYICSWQLYIMRVRDKREYGPCLYRCEQEFHTEQL